MEHTPAAQFRTGRQPAPATAPAFDPDHPDAEILADFANYQRLKVWAYAQEDIHGENWPAGSAEQVDDQQAELERGIFGNHATTPIGAAAQLITLLPALEQSERWFDRGLVEKGLRAFYDARKALPIDGTTQQLLSIAFELIDMEWCQALAAYERSEEDFRLAEALSDLTADEMERQGANGGTPSPYVAEVWNLAQQMIARRTDTQDLSRLLRTLTPTLEDYRRKAAIVQDGRLGTIAAPWMLRDVEFLMARVEPPTP